jgi:hypothetical protein
MTKDEAQRSIRTFYEAVEPAWRESAFIYKTVDPMHSIMIVYFQALKRSTA